MKLARHEVCDIAWLVLLWALAACSPPPPVQQQAYVFGTLVEISVYDDPARRRQATCHFEVLARFDELHRTLHAWQPSELSRLNAALARGERATVTPELAAMLRDAQALVGAIGRAVQPGHRRADCAVGIPRRHAAARVHRPAAAIDAG
jgi:thiamine biosynthesis lipoprotein ApbE